MNIFHVFLLILTFALAPSFAHAGDQRKSADSKTVKSGNAAASHESHSLVGKDALYIQRNNRLQKAGHILLIVGSSLCLGGIITMEVMGFSMYGPLATIGFAASGTGITTMLTSFVLLGFSRPYHGSGDGHSAGPGGSQVSEMHLSFVKSF